MRASGALNVAELTDAIRGLGEIEFSRVFWNIPDAIVVVDRNGTIRYVNQAYSRIANLPAAAAIGRHLQDVAPSAHTLRVLRTGEPIVHDSYYSDDFGVGLVLSATPLLQDGELVGVVTVFRTSKEMLDLYAAYRRANGLVDYYQNLLLSRTEDSGCFKAVIGHDRTLASLVRVAAKVAKTDATVLITGENGVGKDILAHAIHGASERRDRPFIVVNCAAVPDSLIESELFGFESGTFTGAARGGRPGKFELAHGGTIFLDEVGDMSLTMQAKVLRVLEQKEIQKIGASRTTPVNVRVLAATNRDLARMVREGAFREDLLYRLNVFPLAIPPLRDRKDDIPELAPFFLTQCAAARGRRLMVDPDSFDVLGRYDWPGNIRQLRNAVERAAILCDGDLLLPEHFGLPQCEKQGAEPSVRTAPAPAAERPAETGEDVLKDRIRGLERQAYEDALSRSRGNKSKAMKDLGVSRRTFYRRIREFEQAGDTEDKAANR